MSTPLYAQVAQRLASSITEGRFPVGSLLPTEMELCDQYLASRPTVRLALQELQAMGLVSRRKRVGTRVESASPSVGFSQSLSSLDGLVQLAEHQIRLVKRVTPVVIDRDQARELGCAPGSRWIHIEVLRLGEGGDPKRPVGWTDTYIDGDYEDVPKLLKKSPKMLISSLIETHYGRRIAEVEQTVQAIAMPRALAKVLEALEGSPALKIVRKYVDQANEVFEMAVTVHPADRMVCTTKLRRERA
jgi:GntR family transcriptional regulator